MYAMAYSATKSTKLYFTVFPFKTEQKKIIQKKYEGLVT